MAKIDELLDYLTVVEVERTKEPSYGELLAMYEKEKTSRVDIETNFTAKASESHAHVENLNMEMCNLAALIDELRTQHASMQTQHRFQMDTLVKLNDEIRGDMQALEHKNEKLRIDNLRLKAENKQFVGEQHILARELDTGYQAPSTLDEAVRALDAMRAETVKLVVANQALNKQLNVCSESLKSVQKLNAQLQRAHNVQDQMAIAQSLESELERERKVRCAAESDKAECVAQLRQVKEKSQALVEMFRQRNELNEVEVRKLRDENAELANQIGALKRDAQNNLSVQEDLVRLIQSLQIELNECKTLTGDHHIGQPHRQQVRCQHEDDFTECTACKSPFKQKTATAGGDGGGGGGDRQRCKHCCKIFCHTCCAKVILSGPNQRPHNVCDSCHTLLDKDEQPPSTRS